MQTLEQKVTREDTPTPSSLMVAFKTPLILNLSFSYFNINARLFTIKTTVVFFKGGELHEDDK